MPTPFRFRPKNPTNWFHSLPSKSNQRCPYCHRFVGEGSPVPSNREHLIGTSFVPKGTLGGDAFNFIFRACVDCNVAKSVAEGHVSATTLWTSPAVAADPALAALATRKAAGDFHPTERGKRVKDATPTLSTEYDFGGATMTFTMIGPPQLARSNVTLLTRCHVQGLFYMLTNATPNDDSTYCLLSPKNIHLLGYYTARDWGNPWLREIQDRAAAWPCYAKIDTAQGFFRAIMRRSERDDDGWFWALEWNNSVRLVGAIISPDLTSPIFQNLPSLGWQVLPNGTDRIRQDVPLSEADDTLFVGEAAAD